MIILPDRGLSRGKFLIAIPKRQWMPSSRAVKKDQFGENSIRVIFVLTARLSDGSVFWKGVFEDRDDADAFLFSVVSGSIAIEKELWRLPKPHWDICFGLELSYSFATLTFLSSPTGSNQTGWTVPNDWNNLNNSIEVVGAGGGGGVSRQANGTDTRGAGGGGGAYSKITNLTLTKGSTPTWYVGASATAVSRTTNGVTTGNTGGDTYFNGTTLAGASVGAKGGAGGTAATGAQATGGAGGASSSGIGTTKYSGGTAGNCTGASGGYIMATGGGGAAGQNGNGGNSNSVNAETNNSLGGTANGQIWSTGYQPGDGSYGTISGAGTTITGVNGYDYGGGAGGVGVYNYSGTVTGGAGSQGIIVITNTEFSLANFNLSMIGM